MKKPREKSWTKGLVCKDVFAPGIEGRVLGTCHLLAAQKEVLTVMCSFRGFLEQKLSDQATVTKGVW